MVVKVFEFIGKFGLVLVIAGGVVNFVLYNGEVLRGGGFLFVVGGCLLVCIVYVIFLMVVVVCECVCVREGLFVVILYYVVVLLLDFCFCSYRFV